MSDIKVISPIAGITESNKAIYAAALDAGNVVLSHEISGVSKYTAFAQALNALGKSLAPSYIWFAFTGAKMSGPCKAIYETLQDAAVAAEYSNFYSTWTRVREYGAEITLSEIKAANAAGEKHPWESASAIAQSLVDAKEERLAKARALKKQKKTEAEKPEAEKPEAEKPEAEKPEAEKPEAEKPEAEKPEAAKPEAAKPEAAKPEAAKPEAAKPEAAKPEAAKPEAAKPEAAKPEAAKPATVADVTDTGPVDDTKARAAFIKAKEALPIGERVVIDMSELIEDIINVVQGIDAGALSMATRKALGHILTAQWALAKDIEKAKAHLSRLNQGGAQ